MFCISEVRLVAFNADPEDWAVTEAEAGTERVSEADCLVLEIILKALRWGRQIMIEVMSQDRKMRKTCFTVIKCHMKIRMN